MRSVTIHAADTQWNASVYVYDQQPQSAPSGTADGSGQNLGTDPTITVAQPKPGQYVWVWITYLPPSDKLRVLIPVGYGRAVRVWVLRSLIALLLAGLVGGAVLVGLAVWQIASPR